MDSNFVFLFSSDSKYWLYRKEAFIEDLKHYYAREQNGLHHFTLKLAII